MTYFPEEVFSLIKSFTKPEIWECECCQEEFNKAKDEPAYEDKFCEDCVEDYLCSCGGCETLVCHFQCENCGIDTCSDCQGLYDDLYVPGEYIGYCLSCVENAPP